jgi:hypothetical protein
MSPIPNGGFMFEAHQDDILVIEGAKFNDNLNYLYLVRKLLVELAQFCLPQLQ